MARPKYPSDTQDQLMVRFPEGMRQRLKEMAVRNLRSMNNEIVLAVSERLERDAKEKSGNPA